jgi:Methuselah N-terminus
VPQAISVFGVLHLFSYAQFSPIFSTIMTVQVIATLAFLLATGSSVRATSSIQTYISEPCHYLDTVPIIEINAQQEPQTGAIYYNNVKFETTQFGWFDYVYVNGRREKSNRHLRGCLCAVAACFRICQENVDPMAPITAEVENKMMNLTNHQLVFGQPCARMHQDNETALELKDNGAVYDVDHNISINHEFYCLNVDNNVVVSKLVCVPGKW